MMKLIKKKGQGLSLNTIVIAAIALIVLVVLIFIFSGKIKVFGRSSESCNTAGGVCDKNVYSEQCIKLGTCKCEGNSVYIPGTDCEAQTSVCCKQVY